MEIAKLILEYIRAFVWPSAVIVCLILFREELRNIIIRLRKANLPGGISIDFFKKGLEEAQNLSQKVTSVKPVKSRKLRKKYVPIIPFTEVNKKMLDLGLQPSPSDFDMSYYRELASLDPYIALSGLRLELEILAKNLAKGFNIEIGYQDSGLKLLQKLRDTNIITTDQMKLFQKVLQLCNIAIHGGLVSLEDANSVIDIANVLRDQYFTLLSVRFKDTWHPSNAS